MAAIGVGKGYILVGTDTSGTVFYTGGAGTNWVSPSWNEAFRYETKQLADTVAARFNGRTVLHGITFEVKFDVNRLAVLREIFFETADQRRRERAFGLIQKIAQRNIDKARNERRIYPVGA